MYLIISQTHITTYTSTYMFTYHANSIIDFHAINQLNDKDVILGIATYMNYDSVMLRYLTVLLN